DGHDLVGERHGHRPATTLPDDSLAVERVASQRNLFSCTKSGPPADACPGPSALGRGEGGKVGTGSVQTRSDALAGNHPDLARVSRLSPARRRRGGQTGSGR